MISDRASTGIWKKHIIPLPIRTLKLLRDRREQLNRHFLLRINFTHIDKSQKKSQDHFPMHFYYSSLVSNNGYLILLS